MYSQQQQQQTQERAYYDQATSGPHPAYREGQMAQHQPYGPPGVYDQRQYAPGATYADGRPHFSTTTSFDGPGYSYQHQDTGDYHPGVPPTSMSARGRAVSLPYNPPLHSPGAYGHHGHYLQPDGYPADSGSYFADGRSGGPPGSPGAHTQQGLASTRPVPTRLNTAPVYLDDSQHSPSGLSSHSPSALRASVDTFHSSSSQQSGAGSSSSLLPSSTTNAPQARPHVCEHCGLAFVRGHDLKRHLSTHSNTKPHVCECGKSFSRKDALKRHAFLKSCGAEKGYTTPED